MLLEQSADADMLVVGARGHGGFIGLVLGSVSDQCTRHAHIPVVVVPAPPDEKGPAPSRASLRGVDTAFPGIRADGRSARSRLLWALAEEQRREIAVDRAGDDRTLTGARPPVVHGRGRLPASSTS